jgi:hypothetical protein
LFQLHISKIHKEEPTKYWNPPFWSPDSFLYINASKRAFWKGNNRKNTNMFYFFQDDTMGRGFVTEGMKNTRTYIYDWYHRVMQSARLYTQSSALGPPHPSPARECCPPPIWIQGGSTLACGWGGGRSQFGRLEKKPSTLFTLWFWPANASIL